MPKKFKRQKTLIKNLLNVNRNSPSSDDLYDSKLISQNNKTNENDIKLAENIEGIFFYNSLYNHGSVSYLNYRLFCY